MTDRPFINTGETVRVAARGTPWALLCTCLLGFAKWGLGMSIPLAFVFLPVFLVWVVLACIALMVLVAFVLFWICMGLLLGVAKLADIWVALAGGRRRWKFAGSLRRS